MDGEDLPYADFFVEKDGEDITEPMLLNQGYTFLLISPHLEQADDSQLDRINEVHEYAQDYNYPFYCLTASGQQGIQQWQERTGAEYAFCQTDDIVLKTMIRSNPGLMLLKDGKVIRKWSHNRMPSGEVLTKQLHFLEIGQMPEDSVPHKIMIILLWYVLPLLLLTLADRLWMWSNWLKKKDKKQ
jgi:triosephosphate isomerase